MRDDVAGVAGGDALVDDVGVEARAGRASPPCRRTGSTTTAPSQPAVRRQLRAEQAEQHQESSSGEAVEDGVDDLVGGERRGAGHAGVLSAEDEPRSTVAATTGSTRSSSPCSSKT